MQCFWVPCECGCWYKEFLKASERARNPGRYYYRCPNGNSTCSFIWADEFLTQRYEQLHPYISIYAPPPHNVVNDQDVGSGIRERNRSPMLGSQILSTPCKGIVSEEVSSTFNHCDILQKSMESGAKGNLDALGLICCCLGSVALALSFVLILVCFFIILK